MGWLYCGESKDEVLEIIRKDLRQAGYEVMGEALRGGRYWVALRSVNYIREVDETVFDTFICLYLLRGDGGSGCFKWGYKDMDESMHPYYYDCPLWLLNATRPEGREESTWRKAVREYHAVRKRTPKPRGGMTVTYQGTQYLLNYPLGSRRGWDVTRTQDGMNFRMKAKQVAAALRQEV